MSFFSLVQPAANNTGYDVDLTVTDQNGNTIAMGNVKSFKAEAINHELDTTPINLKGEMIPTDIPHGAKGTIMIDRSDGRWEAFYLAIIAAFQAGNGQVYGSIAASVANRATPNSPPSKYLYSRAAMHLSDFGSYSADSLVEQTITWRAGAWTQTQ